MADIPRLNGIIRALEKGQTAFTSFSPLDVNATLGFASSKFDGVVFECEHGPWDAKALRDCLQYLLDRAQIAKSGSLAPKVTPMVRIPPNGAEMNQFFAKQALDLGAYGLIWPHVSTVEEAMNAVGSSRYPRLKSAPLYEPRGLRGDGPTTAARYWGLSQQEYYTRADVWPLAPQGEIFVILMIEDTLAIENLRDILRNVKGIGAVLIGEGDLSQELGYPRQYEHPVVVEAMDQIVATCKEEGVIVGHPHVSAANAQAVLDKGYRFIMAGPSRSYSALEKAMQIAGR